MSTARLKPGRPAPGAQEEYARWLAEMQAVEEDRKKNPEKYAKAEREQQERVLRAEQQRSENLQKAQKILEPFLSFIPAEEREACTRSIAQGTKAPASLLIWGDKDRDAIEEAGFLIERSEHFGGCTQERCNCKSHDQGAYYYTIHSNQDKDQEIFLFWSWEHHNRSLRQRGSQDGDTREYLHIDLDTQRREIVTIVDNMSRHSRVSIQDYGKYSEEGEN